MVVRSGGIGAFGGMNIYGFSGESNGSITIHNEFAISDMQFNASGGGDNYLIGIRSDCDLTDHFCVLIICNLIRVITAANGMLLLSRALTGNEALIGHGRVAAQAVVEERQVIVSPGIGNTGCGGGQSV